LGYRVIWLLANFLYKETILYLKLAASWWVCAILSTQRSFYSESKLAKMSQKTWKDEKGRGTKGREIERVSTKI